MPNVAFHIKALEPEGGTLPSSRLDYDEYYDDASDTDDDLYYDDDDNDDDVDSNGDDSYNEDLYLEEPEEEFEMPLESSLSLRRKGSTHIRDLTQPALARYGTLGSVHIEDLAQPGTLSRYGTLSSVHIEDIMPTPTDYLDRYESAHIEDLTRMQGQGQHIHDMAPDDYNTHANQPSRSKSSKSGSKSGSRSRSKSKSRKPKSGRNEKESKESKESKPKSRSRSKSNSSRQRQRSRSRPKNKTKEATADYQASKSLRKSKKKSKPSSSSTKSTKSSLHTILSPKKKSSSSKQEKLYLSPLEVHNSISNATKTPTQPKHSRSKSKQKSSPQQSDQLYPSKESIATTTTTSHLDEEPIDDPNSAFLQEQRELLEKIARNDAKLEALKEQKQKKSPPHLQQQQQPRVPKPKKHAPQHHHRRPRSPLVVDESILDALEPHEREFFLQEQQQLLDKIRRDRASREADARYAQELAASQQHEHPQQHPHNKECYRSSSFAKQDEGTASTCSPGSSLESSSPLWAASVVDPPLLDVVPRNPNPSHRHRRAYY